MQFSTWVSKSDIPRGEIAESLRITRAHLAYLMKGERNPSLGLAMRIRDLTAGKVRPEDWPRSGNGGLEIGRGGGRK